MFAFSWHLGFTRKLILVLVSLFYHNLSTNAASGAGFSLGLGMLEQGDTRLKPHIALHFKNSDFQYGFFYTKNTFGPVSTSSQVINFGQIFTVPLIFPEFNIVLGGSLMRQNTTISYPGSLEFNKNEDNYNIGVLAGFFLNLYEAGRISTRVAWESNIFAAGQAAIFLATARKEYLYLAMGFSL